MAKKLPRKNQHWNFRKVRFEITNDAIYELTALFILVRDYSLQQAIRYVFKNFKVAENLHAITDDQWSELGAEINNSIVKYGALSRNKRKEALRDVIDNVKEAE